MEIVDLIGFVGAILTTVAFFPQAYKVFKTNQTRDISSGFCFLFIGGSISWLTYGMLIVSGPIISANVVSLFMQIYILMKKMNKA
ncbi:SemiSWEET transporter [Candidatus Bathyarchaeota archaeon]|nr:SemiSWEET transporter [Candidatus Bathyarchaeota archaeon]